ncbi:MAG: FtsX-like permease family protein, partial [Actinomycetia bacterium]|nr:FtsX-like permease family protein [Actinomycetes bacterium]
SLKNPRKVDTVANRLKTIQYVKDLAGDLDKNVQYGKDTVKRLFAVTRWVSIAAGGFATLLIFVSLVLITNTIRLAIFARRKEIGIMRLVGASNWFIRWPFILEGMFEGFIGASVAILILVGVWRTLFTNLASGKVLAFLSFQIDQTAFIKLILLLALSGAVIGSAGSFIALRRFLKV